ncbi:MAG: pyridoxamine 5'-phosphate oxidase family protein [Paenibacillus sp.]|uniref:pyridoxamine 5'-phosphate oxidase family protein n=1 Tax=Paenibacillus sp. TaxID=58172 RepID=UPI0025CEB864|nr:pyridoxamine 5'-phosphate oxidase family protein [Paenibacillus sp.]MBR2566613.1 pyridoxamine 5'-phosphate oxidase family protein [Paenibacillus sp.]
MEIAQLDAELLEWFSGSDLENKQHEAMQLLTVTDGQWPHVAMISMGEVVALSPNGLRLALWRGTQTSMNMMETGKATLIAIYGQRLLHIRLEVQLLPELTNAVHPRDRYECKIRHIRIDQAPYAEITSGITFQLKDETATLIRWVDTIEELKK